MVRRESREEEEDDDDEASGGGSRGGDKMVGFKNPGDETSAARRAWGSRSGGAEQSAVKNGRARASRLVGRADSAARPRT